MSAPPGRRLEGDGAAHRSPTTSPARRPARCRVDHQPELGLRTSQPSDRPALPQPHRSTSTARTPAGPPSLRNVPSRSSRSGWSGGGGSSPGRPHRLAAVSMLPSGASMSLTSPCARRRTCRSPRSAGRSGRRRRDPRRVSPPEPQAVRTGGTGGRRGHRVPRGVDSQVQLVPETADGDEELRLLGSGSSFARSRFTWTSRVLVSPT